MSAFLSKFFNPAAKPADLGTAKSAPLTGEIDKTFQPKKGSFFRTLEYPELDEQGQPEGKAWLEAGLNPETKQWVLWSKSIHKIEDVLNGEMQSIMVARALFDATNFMTCFDNMTTFEQSRKSLGQEPLTSKTPAKLGGDYYKQFVWREGLMMSRSGRLYPLVEDNANSVNYFNEQDILDAKKFLERIRTEQFVAVPLVLPSINFEKSYAANKQRTDERLNRLTFEHQDNKDSLDLALQIVAHEAPEVLYAHLKRGFNSKLFEENPAQHFALLKAAIDRDNIEPLNLLAEDGISFYAQHEGTTPLAYAIKNRRYSHQHIMLSRDGNTLANYADADNKTPALQAIAAQDIQAFRMIYQEGIDYTKQDKDGWSLVHHAFAQNFMTGIYAWLDEGLPIDQPIQGTAYTGLSLAKQKGFQPLIEYAQKNGANADCPVYQAPEKVAMAAPVQQVDGSAFNVALLSSAKTNQEIENIATAYVAAGGNLNLVDDKGVSLLEMCWKNRKSKPEMNRAALIPVFAKLGIDSSALLDSGTTALNRAVSGSTFDVEYLKAIAPLAKNPNTQDNNGNNVLHALQLNSQESVSNSSNVSTLLKLFPTLDLNQQNNDGFSNVGLAIRLNRSQTLKVLPANAIPDWSQTTKSGWSYLDIAFTSACAQESLSGTVLEEKIKTTSEALRDVVLSLLDKTAKGTDATKKEGLTATFNRSRPDGKTLHEALTEENAPTLLINRLTTYGLAKNAKP